MPQTHQEVFRTCDKFVGFNATLQGRADWTRKPEEWRAADSEELDALPDIGQMDLERASLPMKSAMEDDSSRPALF